MVLTLCEATGRLERGGSTGWAVHPREDRTRGHGIGARYFTGRKTICTTRILREATGLTVELKLCVITKSELTYGYLGVSSK